MRIGIPRGLIYYNYYPFWHAFFTELGIEVVGDTKVKILTEDDEDDWQLFDEKMDENINNEIDNEVKEDFIN